MQLYFTYPKNNFASLRLSDILYKVKVDARRCISTTQIIESDDIQCTRYARKTFCLDDTVGRPIKKTSRFPATVCEENEKIF